MLVPGWLAGTLIFTAMAHTSIAGVDAQPAATDGSQGAAQGSALLDRLAITGDASNDIEDVVRKAILRGLSGQGVRTVEPPADVAAAGPCTDAACTAARARAAGSDFVVSGKVLVSERSYEVTLELHEGKDGRLLATRRASCPICSVPEVEKAAADVAGELAGGPGSRCSRSTSGRTAGCATASTSTRSAAAASGTTRSPAGSRGSSSARG